MEPRDANTPHAREKHSRHAFPPSLFLSVDGGERAVMYDRVSGIRPEPVGEGTHFRIPWIQVKKRRGEMAEREARASAVGRAGQQAGSICSLFLSRPRLVSSPFSDPARHGHPDPPPHHLIGDGDER